MSTDLRQRNREELRRLILEAAMDIFVGEGYESFSMRKLAQRIGYSAGSIYQHFRDKEELFDCLVNESFERLLKVQQELEAAYGDQDPVGLLKVGLRTYVEFGLSNANHYRFAFLLKPPSPAVPYVPHPVFEVPRSMVRRCVEEKRFRAVDVETTAQAIWAAIHGITSLLIQKPNFPWVDKDRLIGQVIDSAVDSLVEPPGTAAEGAEHGTIRRR